LLRQARAQPSSPSRCTKAPGTPASQILGLGVRPIQKHMHLGRAHRHDDRATKRRDQRCGFVDGSGNTPTGQ